MLKAKRPLPPPYWEEPGRAGASHSKLQRRDLPELIRMLAQLPQIEDISLTTNGLLLERSAEDLAEAGLNRINVSLDTLLPHRYRAMTRRDGLARVLSGIETAARFGLSPIKVYKVGDAYFGDGSVRQSAPLP